MKVNVLVKGIKAMSTHIINEGLSHLLFVVRASVCLSVCLFFCLWPLDGVSIALMSSLDYGEWMGEICTLPRRRFSDVYGQEIKSLWCTMSAWHELQEKRPIIHRFHKGKSEHDVLNADAFPGRYLGNHGSDRLPINTDV